MIRSMTGFGRGAARATSGTVTVELRSVNHRFLEVVPHLPSALQLYEERVRDLVRQQLRRGRVTCTATLRLGAARAAKTSLDTQLARHYAQQLKRLAQQLRLPDAVTLQQLLVMPRVLVVEEPEQLQVWWPLLERAVLAGIRQLSRMRAREGRATARDLLRHLTVLERTVAAITTRAPAVVTDHRARLARRVQELAQDVPVDPQRLAAEVALFAANADIAEEGARLQSHVAQFRRAVQSTGEQGRTLDFLAQEMFREANTMGAKANDYLVTTHVITLKGALEKIREQVQNVE